MVRMEADSFQLKHSSCITFPPLSKDSMYYADTRVFDQGNTIMDINLIKEETKIIILHIYSSHHNFSLNTTRIKLKNTLIYSIQRSWLTYSGYFKIDQLGTEQSYEKHRLKA